MVWLKSFCEGGDNIKIEIKIENDDLYFVNEMEDAYLV